MIKANEIKTIVIYIGSYVLLMVAEVVLVSTTNIDWNNPLARIRLISIMNLSFYGIMVFLFISLFVTYWQDVFKQFNQNRMKYVKLIALGFLSITIATVLISQLYVYLGITDTSVNQELLNNLLNGGLFDRISLIIFAVFLAPIAEEMVFRMASFGLLKQIRNIKPWMTITLASFIFGFIHVMGAFDFEQIFYYAGLGAVLGFFYHKSENIIVPIIIHMLINGVVAISMFI